VRANTDDDDLLSIIATELHNASFHQTEAMIAFLLCEFQNRPGLGVSEFLRQCRNEKRRKSNSCWRVWKYY
jgi:hypothetical protein